MASTRISSPRSGRPTVSGLVICYNEEANIEACLDSLTWCDEILVVDSFSTDGTPELARRNPKVRFHQRAFRGGASQRNWALERVRHDWVFVLDADERCPADLRREIDEAVSAESPHEAYTIRRRCFFLGREIRFSGLRNDRAVRLFRNGAGYYNNRRVHEAVVTARPAPMLRHRIDHYFVECLDAYVRRISLYGYWAAAQYWRDGRHPSPAVQVVIRTPWRFVRMFVLQLGFLDGIRGFTLCLLQTYGTYFKWSLLWSWYENAKRGRQPVLPEFDDDPAVWRGLATLKRQTATTAATSTRSSPATVATQINRP